MIANDLLEAYKGYYEDDLKPFNDDTRRTAVQNMISQDTPKKRLEVYLEWNGIIGYSTRAFEIATGEL